MRHRSFVFLGLLAGGAALAVACSDTPGGTKPGTGGASTQSGSNGGSGNGTGGASPQTGSNGGSGNSTGGASTHTGSNGGSGGAPPAGCTNLQCTSQVDNCAAKGKSQTTISGTVYDPAGKLPLYNVYVYIPNEKPDPILAGNPTCTQCQAPASGSRVIGALTDANGKFTLQQGATDKWGVPSGADIPLVLQVGKWRRQITIPSVTACADNPLPDPATPKDKLRLPAKGSEGDMPFIAFTSGCDPAECFLRNIGIDDSEFVAPGNPAGHVHFYTGQDASGVSGNASSVAGGNTWQDTYLWWSNASNLKKYDIVFNACECSDSDRNSNAAGGDAYAAMKEYLDGGGRVFSTHYHYNWFAPPTGPTDFQGTINWALPEGMSVPFNNYYIDTTFPKGQAFADWLYNQGVTPTKGQITLSDTRYDMNTTTAASTRWIYSADSPAGPYATMYMSFNTPVAQPANMQCGRAMYSDVHLSGSSDDSQFPNECANADFGGTHAVNEKALEFLFFDLSSCVQDNSMPPPPPPQ